MPDVNEMLHSPQALAEGRQQAQQLPPEHLAELVQVTKQESEQSNSRQREDWQRWWDEWSGDVTFADKEEWQNQLWINKPFAVVEQATGIVQRSLVESPDFFGVEGTGDDDKLVAEHVAKPILTKFLDEAGFRPKMTDAAKLGFMMGVVGYLKYRWLASQVPTLAGVSVDPETGALMPAFQYRTASMLAIDYILPWRIFRDPDTQPRENYTGTYLIHSEFRDRPAIAGMARYGWEQEAITRLLERGASGTASDASTLTESQQRDAERKHQTWTRHKFRRAYAVDEWWGDVLDQNGDVVFPNALMVHSQGEMLKLPVDSPVWATDLQTGRRKWPIIAGCVIGHPSRFEGRGILEQAEGLALMFSSTVNLMADALNWDVNPSSEVYVPGLVNFDDLSNYPGKQWAKNVKDQVIAATREGKVDVGKILAFLQFLDSNMENVDFVTSFVSGLPGHRSDITLGETRLKTSQGMGLFESLLRNVEDLGRVGVELAWDMILQYLGGNDYAHPSLLSILGPKAMLLAQMSLSERIEALQGNFRFTFTGLSATMQRAETLQKMMQAATLAASGPYAGRVDYSQILRKLFELLGVADSIDVITPQPALPPMGGPPGLPVPGGAPSPAAMPQRAATIRALGADTGAAAPAMAEA